MGASWHRACAASRTPPCRQCGSAILMTWRSCVGCDCDQPWASERGPSLSLLCFESSRHDYNSKSLMAAFVKAPRVQSVGVNTVDLKVFHVTFGPYFCGDGS